MAQRLSTGFGFGGYLPACFADRTSGIPQATAADLDATLMRQALVTAMQNCGLPSPNPCVGAVFTRNGQIISAGATESYGGLHAEKKAVSHSTIEKLRGSTLYVGLEPCSHFGKQPPCVDSLKPLELQRAVIACRDLNPLVAGNGMRFLQDSGITLTEGVLHNEWRAWHLPFFAALKRNRPIFVGKWAQTLDGFLADDQGQSKWISGPESRAYTHWLRMKYDMVMIGAGTLLRDAPALTVRDVPQVTRQPHVLILDPKAKLLTTTPEQRDPIVRKLVRGDRKYLYVTSKVHWQNAVAFWTNHPEVLSLGLTDLPSGWDELPKLLQSTEVEQHFGRPIQSVFVEGGPSTLTQMLRRNLLDLCHVFIAPQLMFGRANRIADPLQLGAGLDQASRMEHRLTMEMMASFNLGQDTVLELLAHDLLDLFTQTSAGTS